MASIDDSDMQPKPRKAWVKWAILAAFVGVILVFFALGGREWLSLERLQANLDRLATYTAEHYWATLLVFGVVYTAVTVFALPGASLFTLAGGFLFGTWVGTLLVTAFATLGSVLLFWGARYLFGDKTREKLKGNGRMAKMVRGFEEDAFGYLLFLRLVPVFPFALVNTVPALTAISTRTYTIATAIGILPATFVYCNLGKTLPNIRSLGELASGRVLLSLVLLGLLALMPIVVKRIYAARHKALDVE